MAGATEVSKLIRFTAPTVKSVPMVRVDRGVSNLMVYSYDWDTITTTYLVEQLNCNTTASQPSSAKALYGDNSYYIEGLYASGGAYMNLIIRPKGNGTFYLNDNKYYCAIGHYYLEGFLRNADPTAAIPTIKLYPFETTNVEYLVTTGTTATALGNGWYRTETWFRTDSDVPQGASSDDMYMLIDLDDTSPATFPTAKFDEVSFYLDCMAVYEYDDMYYSDCWQPSGTDRADEVLIAPAYSVGGSGSGSSGGALSSTNNALY